MSTSIIIEVSSQSPCRNPYPKHRAERRQCDSKSLVFVSVWFFPGLANDSGSSESSLGMMIKAKLSLTFMQNVICKPPAMSSLLIFFLSLSPFLSKHNTQCEIRRKGFSPQKRLVDPKCCLFSFRVNFKYKWSCSRVKCAILYLDLAHRR